MIAKETLKAIREDFPSLKRSIRNKPVIYLDSACTTLKPVQVIEAMNRYYLEFPSCHGRNYHLFGRETTEAYEDARKAIQKFIGAKFPEEIIFTRNTTEGINLVSRCLPLSRNDIVMTSDMEHNSNLLPWQNLSRSNGTGLKLFHIDIERGFDIESLKSSFSGDVKLVSTFHRSNLTGLTLPVKEIAKVAHERGALILIDGAQSVLSEEIDVCDMDVDFFAFSVHKMLGPTGVGVLYGKRKILNKLPQFITGGETVLDSTYPSSTPAPLPQRFEAGIQNYGGVAGSKAAIEYITKIGKSSIESHIADLGRIALDGLKGLPGLNIIGSKDCGHSKGIVNFFIDGLESKALAFLLDNRENIMVRHGKHCAHSWFNANKLPDSLRVSFCLYNTEEEVELFVRTVAKVAETAS